MTRSGQANNPSRKWLLKRNRPPEGKPWVWLTEEMLDSPAWRSLPKAARGVVDRVMIEHSVLVLAALAFLAAIALGAVVRIRCSFEV